MNEYLTDEELLKLISDVEENDLVEAPPEIVEKVLEKIDKKKQIIEYKRFRNRVITSVAAIIILTTFSSNWFKISYAEINKLETTNNKIFTYFDNSHYISDLLNGKEE